MPTTFTFMSKDGVVVTADAFNRPVLFQSQQLVQLPDGGFDRQWVTVYKTWAHIEPWRGREFLQAGQVWPQMWNRVIIRYRPSQNIDATMRMVHGKKTYNIRSVWVVAEAHKVIELLVEEVQAMGTLETTTAFTPNQA